MSAWNGLPDKPERSGWHWLKHEHDNIPQPFEWSSDKGEWNVDIDGEGFPEEMVDSGYQYICPCPDPSELAQMRKDERERCLDIAIYERGNFPSNPEYRTPSSDTAYRACNRIIEAIRALTDDGGKKS